MTVIKISITRALAELKTLNKRIEKLTLTTTFASTYIVGRAWTDHSQQTKNAYQTLCDLIKRYTVLKNAIINSNAVTKVTICEVEYTVAEAIARKESIKQQVDLLAYLKQAQINVKNAVVHHNDIVQNKLDNLLEKNFSNSRKSDDTDVKSITDAFLKNNKIVVVDPLKLDTTIVELESTVDDFKKEVDFVLSESNALTKISV